MKKGFISIIFLICGLYLYAQDYVPTKNDLDRFYKTKLLVVLENNPMLEYNLVIQEVIKTEWKLTPFDFIQESEFEEKRLDPQYSFLVLTKVDFSRDKTAANYKFLHILLGGDYFRINMMPDLVAVPLAYEEVDEDSYIYKLATMLRFMQMHMKMITNDPDLITNNVFKYYRDNIDSIKNKTLYVVKDELSKEVNTEERIKKIYPYKIKIVTREEVQKAIEDKDPNVVFLHKVGPEGTKLFARCYKIIIGADEPKLYYFDYHMIDEKKPDGFLEKDFINLAKGKTFISF